MARMKELERENRQLKKMYAEERLKAEIVKEALEKNGKPSCRCKMAKAAVKEKKTNIRQACEAFSFSQTCYSYEPKLSAENELIADWLSHTSLKASKSCKSPQPNGSGHITMTAPIWVLAASPRCKN